MDWLDAITAALAIVAVPLALRYSLAGRASRQGDADASAACDCLDHEHVFPQEEEPTQSGNPAAPKRAK